MSRTKEDIQKELEYICNDIDTLREEIDEKECYVESLSRNENTDEFDDYLDDLYGEFMGMYASYILKNLDETSYYSSMNEFNYERINEAEKEIDNLGDELAELLEEEDNLIKEIKELEDEIQM